MSARGSCPPGAFYKYHIYYKRKEMTEVTEMRKNTSIEKTAAISIGALVGIITLVIGFLGKCIAINIHVPAFWLLLALALLLSTFTGRLIYGKRDFIQGLVVRKKRKGKGRIQLNSALKPYIAPVAIAVLVLVVYFIGSPLFFSTRYASILQLQETDFSEDIPESAGTDSIALMDTASAQMLGDREIGSLSNVVSQFDVSTDYAQIDYQGRPIKVSALGYADFFKWINNKEQGVCGYITVDPVSMTASYHEAKGMKYVPTAYFFENAKRCIWLKFPTTMFGNIHFEIDEDGNPYYIASVYKKTIGLFNGKTVDGCIILDPITGEATKYALSDIPRWVDIVFDGDLLCTQFNWNGTLQNGFLNSLIGKKGCKQVTTYSSGENEEDDEAPACDYGYVAKDGDIWIYTGVTSLNGDSSNIGFLLANERTGECHYFNIAGADEKSAMASAEGEVQEKGYQASFPALINVSDNSTYIMVLKDAGGLVKQYAAVNVEQYNIVATAPTQGECIAKYRSLLGITEADEAPDAEIKRVTIQIQDIKYIDIDGNTYIYLIDEQNAIFKAKAATHEDMLLLKQTDTVELTCSGSEIITCTKK